MINKSVKNAATFAFLLTGMAAASMVQAGDIKPLHHSCYAGNAINWPKPTGAGSPTGVGTSLNILHGGSGALAAGATSDIIRFTCPAAQQGSFEINVRDKGVGNVATNVRAAHQPAGPSITDATGADLVWGSVATKNGPLATWDVKIDKPGGTAARSYELCVQCYSGANETGTTAQPTGAVYTQNQ